jgi:hypothetical protein
MRFYGIGGPDVMLVTKKQLGGLADVEFGFIASTHHD